MDEACPDKEVMKKSRRWRAAICWPAPRQQRVSTALADEALYEQMDGLSYLRDQHFDVEVIDSSPDRWNPGAGRGSLLAGIDPLRFIRQLLRYRHYDVLIGADSPSVLLFVLLKRALKLKKPVVIIDPALNSQYRNRMRLHSLVLPYVDEVVVFGKIQVEFLEREYGGRVSSTFIRHRMDCRFFDPALAPEPPSDPAQRYVLAVGNDIGRDYETLLAAATSLPMPVLIHTRRKLPQALPRNVRVQSDWITFEELRLLYARASVVVMPLKETVHASGTNGVLEALAMGRPVVVSASSGIRDYIIDGVTALTPLPGDIDGLRRAVLDLWAKPEVAESLGYQARNYALEKLSMPTYAAQIASILLRAIRSASGARSEQSKQ